MYCAMSGVTASHTQNVKIAKPFMNEDIVDTVASILRSGMMVQGKYVKEFETKLSNYIGAKHVIAVNSGTAALHVAIFAVLESRRKPISPGDAEVVTTPLSFAATANAVLHAGCTPVFADVDPETFNIDPNKADDKVSERTIAIEPVDVFGLPADLEKINSIANAHGFPVVEDAAEAIGASLSGKKIGTISELTCFSTYATKNLHTGEGGFVTTADDDLARSMEMIRSQGQSSKYNHKMLGYNYRMLEMSAAIGIPQISILDDLNSKRRENAKSLKETLSHVPSLTFQRVAKPEEHAWYMFSLLLDERKAGMSRDKFVSKLKESGIDADVSWPTPIHLQPYFRERFGYKEGDFPISEMICKSIFQLPIQPFLTSEEVHRTSSAVKSILPH